MQQVCTTQAGPIFLCFLRNYETNVLLDLKKTKQMMKHVIEPTEEEEKKRFFHII